MLTCLWIEGLLRQVLGHTVIGVLLTEDTVL